MKLMERIDTRKIWDKEKSEEAKEEMRKATQMWQMYKWVNVAIEQRIKTQDARGRKWR